MAPHLLGVEASRRGRDEKRLDGFAPDVVGHADDRRLDDLRQFGQDLLDFLRADAIAHGLDEIAPRSTRKRNPSASTRAMSPV